MIRSMKILLLDFNPAASVGQTLRTILESSHYPAIELLEDFARVDETLYFCSTRGASPLLWRPDCENGLAALVSDSNPDLVFLILSPCLLENTGPLFESFKGELSRVPFVVVVEAGEPDKMFELLKQGAADFITPPLTASNVLPRLWRLIGTAREEDSIIYTLKEELGLRKLVGKSPAFLSEIKKIPLVAKCDANVLISGETGTGKELVARAVHYLSPRTRKPFVPVNCGALPVDLVENELFGHQRGAFTGALSKQLGLIDEAEGGTIFLDEIDCLPLQVQTKLLRFLQEREYRLLGSAKVIKADVRVIAATNANLPREVEKGTFRQDLYYRLNVVPLVLPPLRERAEDIPILARHFLEKYVDRPGQRVTDFSSDALRKLLLHDWPGNVRELEHVVERAIVLSERPILAASDLLIRSREKPASPDSFRKAKAVVIEEFEKAYIQKLLLAYGGNISKAAKAAQKNRRAFFELIRKHQIEADRFKASSEY